MSLTPEWVKFFSHRIKQNGECIEFTGAKDRRGYGRVGRNNKIYLSHRISFELAKGPIRDGMLICHRCDNPSCINPEHLFEGTSRDNLDDMLSKGRSQKGRGEKHSQARLTEKDVIAIRIDPRFHREIAEQYGISTSFVANIKSGRVWKDIKSDVVNMGYAKGERNPYSKLTADIVRAIKADNRTQQKIADEFGIARTTVGQIKRGETWVDI